MDDEIRVKHFLPTTFWLLQPDVELIFVLYVESKIVAVVDYRVRNAVDVTWGFWLAEPSVGRSGHSMHDLKSQFYSSCREAMNTAEEYFGIKDVWVRET